MTTGVQSISRTQAAMVGMRGLLASGTNPSSLTPAARTATAAIMSLLMARLLQSPEAYWATISTLVVMQSTLGGTLPVSAQRFAGTALGAAVGGLIDSYFPSNVVAFGVCVFLIGVLCAAFRIHRSAYRYASISLAIVMLVRHAHTGMIVAVHRFAEVSIGIVAGLAISALWPEHRRDSTPIAPNARRPGDEWQVILQEECRL